MNNQQSFLFSLYCLVFLSVSPSAAPVSEPTLRTTQPASWDENWMGSPAVYDLDANGTMEIIAGRHSVLYVWDNRGNLIWRAPVGEDASSSNDHGSHRQYAAPVIGDLDGDGFGEIAIAYSNKVAVYDHAGGLHSGTWPQTFPEGEGEIRSLAGADLDRNGTIEIIAVKTSEGPVTMVWDITGSVFPGWPQVKGCGKCNDYGGYNQNIGAADLDGDSLPEVVSTYDICHIGIMHADGSPFAANKMFSSAGPWASSVPMFHDIDLAIQGWGPDDNDRDEFTDSPPCFCDIDGDGLPEIVLYSDHEKAGEYVNRGNCLWVLNPDMTRADGFETPLCSGMPLFTGYENNIVQVAPAPAVADIVDDRRAEIIVPSYDGFVRCFSPEGTVLWQYRFDDGNGTFIGASGAVIGDLNADNVSEVLFTTYSIDDNLSNLILLDNKGILLHKVPIAKRGSMSPPCLADVDGDHKVEIIISLKDVLGGGSGGVQLWDVSSAGDNLLPWPTGRGNNLRNGQSAVSVDNAVKFPHAKQLSSSVERSSSRCALYNLRGQRIRTGALPEDSRSAGGRRNRIMPAGVYLSRAFVNKQYSTDRLILMK